MTEKEIQLAKKFIISAGFLLVVLDIVPAAYQGMFSLAVNAFWLWDV